LRRTVPRVVANITSRLAQLDFIFGQRHDGGDALVLRERQNIDQGLAARLGAASGKPPHLLLRDLAARGEEQHRRVGVGDEQPGDEVLLPGLHAGAALAAAALRPVGRQRHALDIAEVGDGDDHVLALDQVLILHLAFLIDDLGAAGGGELVLHSDHLGLDDRLDASPGAQDVEIVGDLGGELVEFVLDFVAAERGEPLEAPDRGSPGPAGRKDVPCRPPKQPWRGSSIRAIQRGDGCQPAIREDIQSFAGRIRIRRGADQLDHFVDIGDRDGKPDENVSAIARLVEQELGAPRQSLLRGCHEAGQQVLERHHPRTAAVERHPRWRGTRIASW